MSPLVVIEPHAGIDAFPVLTVCLVSRDTRLLVPDAPPHPFHPDAIGTRAPPLAIRAIQDAVLEGRAGAVITHESTELTTLQAKDVHLEGGYVRVVGKGQKERVLPFGSGSQKTLLNQLHHFRPEPVHQGFGNFFLTPDGYAITYDALRLVMNRLAKRSGVECIHVRLWHTFAVNYLVNGGDVFSL